MSHPVRGIDHIVFLVSDLDGAAARFARLGFTLSPRGTHSPHMGSANYTIIFPEDYFELLGIIAETPRNAPKRATLAQSGDSMTAIACRIDDARTARAALGELGISASEATDFSRPLRLPDGSSSIAAFSVAVFSDDDAPNGEIFMCEHKTRDMVWRPELMTHANGAYALAGIVVSAQAPGVLAESYARLFAEGRVKEAEGGFTVETGVKSAPVHCLLPDELLKRYPGATIEQMQHGDFAVLQIAVADISLTQSFLMSSGIGFSRARDGAGLFVAPADAAGNILEFVSK